MLLTLPLFQLLFDILKSPFFFSILCAWLYSNSIGKFCETKGQEGFFFPFFGSVLEGWSRAGDEERYMFLCFRGEERFCFAIFPFLTFSFTINHDHYCNTGTSVKRKRKKLGRQEEDKDCDILQTEHQKSTCFLCFFSPHFAYIV